LSSLQSQRFPQLFVDKVYLLYSMLKWQDIPIKENKKSAVMKDGQTLQYILYIFQHIIPHLVDPDVILFSHIENQFLGLLTRSSQGVLFF
jgi:hypothetical protein